MQREGERDRERERRREKEMREERKRERERDIYIYIYREREKGRHAPFSCLLISCPHACMELPRNLGIGLVIIITCYARTGAKSEGRHRERKEGQGLLRNPSPSRNRSCLPKLC